MLCDAYMDVISKIYQPFMTPEEKREAMYPGIFEDVLPKFLKTIDSICAKGEFLVGD